MSHGSIVARETGISMVINAVLSIVFFWLVFGFANAVTYRELGPDFLPQAFMVALMGSLVPGLLVARRSGAAKTAVAQRAFLLAGTALVLSGGGAFLICRMFGAASISPARAVVIKALFGALLAAAVTPVAVRRALGAHERSPE
jgi:hypothetical protein